MKTRTQSGFTLIELLVVIAIIGILSSVVLASLSSARGKGNTAAIKSTLVNIRTQAELVYATSFSFAGVCSDPVILRARAEAESLNGGEDTVCNASSRDWAIASLTPDGAFCVDADGKAVEGANILAVLADGATSCN
jgi:prepilin-type N-terminal cleavage/methylation domain-containing protein